MSDKRRYPRYEEKESLGRRLSNKRYLRYILRELTGLTMVIYAVLYVLQFRALAAGRAPYETFISATMSPPLLALSMIILALSLYHSVTWLYLNAWLARSRWTELNDTSRLAIFAGTLALLVVASILIAYLIFLR